MGCCCACKPAYYFDIPSLLPTIEKTRNKCITRTRVVDRVYPVSRQPAPLAGFLDKTAIRAQFDTQYLELMTRKKIQDRIRVGPAGYLFRLLDTRQKDIQVGETGFDQGQEIGSGIERRIQAGCQATPLRVVANERAMVSTASMCHGRKFLGGLISSIAP